MTCHCRSMALLDFIIPGSTPVTVSSGNDRSLPYNSSAFQSHETNSQVGIEVKNSTFYLGDATGFSMRCRESLSESVICGLGIEWSGEICKIEVPMAKYSMV